MPSVFFCYPLPRGEMLFLKLILGKQLGLKFFTFFSFFYLPLQHEMTGVLLFQQIPKSPQALTPPLRGVCLSLAYQT